MTTITTDIREAREQARDAIERLCKGRHRLMSYATALAKIGHILSLPPRRTHVALFTLEQCRLVTEFLADMEPRRKDGRQVRHARRRTEHREWRRQRYARYDRFKLEDEETAA